MPLAITATFPLGFYQGKNENREPQKYPDFARLFSALLAGTYSLERNEGTADQKGLVPIDARTFDWLEQNPPDAVELPACHLESSKTIAYRNKGIRDKDKIKIGAERASTAAFLNGPVIWYWNQKPEDFIKDRLSKIAAEVPYLGETASPVLLEVKEVDEIPSQALFKTEPSFDLDVYAMAAVKPGRVKELDDFHAERIKQPKKESTNRKEEECSPSPPRIYLKTEYYKKAEQAVQQMFEVPWRSALLVHIDHKQRITMEKRCAWATRLHKALAKKLGDSLPKSMMHARKDMLPLANSLAIQIINPDMPVCRDRLDIADDAFVVMIPADAPVGEESVIGQALSKIHRLYNGKAGEMNVSFEGEILDDLSHFWTPVSPGFRRLFETVPLFIPEGRPPSKKKSNGEQWTLEDDVRIAIGHVWRTRYPIKASGDKGRIELSEAVAASGVWVGNCKVVPIANPREYSHRLNPGSPLVCSHALMDLSPLDCLEALAAIGQSRHFGGGLLVPFDIPFKTDN